MVAGSPFGAYAAIRAPLHPLDIKDNRRSGALRGVQKRERVSHLLECGIHLRGVDTPLTRGDSLV